MEISDKANVINKIRAAAARRWRLYVEYVSVVGVVVVVGGETNDCVQFVNISVEVETGDGQPSAPSQAKSSHLLEVVSPPRHI